MVPVEEGDRKVEMQKKGLELEEQFKGYKRTNLESKDTIEQKPLAKGCVVFALTTWVKRFQNNNSCLSLRNGFHKIGTSVLVEKHFKK